MKKKIPSAKEFLRRVNAICRNYDIRLLSDEDIISSIAEGFVADIKKVQNKKGLTDLMILDGHYRSSKNGKWAKLRSEDLQKVIDWIETSRQYLSLYGDNKLQHIYDGMVGRLIAIQWFIDLPWKRLPVGKPLPKKIPTATSDLSAKRRQPPPTLIALRLLERLIPKVKKPKPIKSGGTDIKGRAASAASEIMSVMALPISKKGILKAYNTYHK